MVVVYVWACDPCKEQKRRPSGCVPIRTLVSRRTVKVRCRNCLEYDRGCSLELSDVDINEPPTLTATQESAQRKADGTKAKRTPQGPKTQVAERGTSVEFVSGPSKPGPSTAGTQSQPSRLAEEKKQPVETDVPTGSMNPPLMVATQFQESSAVYGPLAVPGRAHYVFTEDLSRYEEAAKNHGGRSLSLANLQIELESIRNREKAELDVIRRVVAQRARLIDHVIEDVAQKIEELGGHPVESSEPEEDGGSEDE